MYAVGNAYRMHTKCIQAYKKRKREEIPLSTSFILPALISSTARFSGNHLLLFVSSGIPRRTVNNLPLLVFADNGLFRAFIARLTGCPPPSRPILNLRLSCAPAGVHAFVRLVGFIAQTDDQKLYALYASKSSLCTLCRNTTPKKTAYNAYRNANRRVRRAEGP